MTPLRQGECLPQSVQWAFVVPPHRDSPRPLAQPDPTQLQPRNIRNVNGERVVAVDDADGVRVGLDANTKDPDNKEAPHQRNREQRVLLQDGNQHPCRNYQVENTAEPRKNRSIARGRRWTSLRLSESAPPPSCASAMTDPPRVPLPVDATNPSRICPHARAQLQHRPIQADVPGAAASRGTVRSPTRRADAHRPRRPTPLSPASPVHARLPHGIPARHPRPDGTRRTTMSADGPTTAAPEESAAVSHAEASRRSTWRPGIRVRTACCTVAVRHAGCRRPPRRGRQAGDHLGQARKTLPALIH